VTVAPTEHDNVINRREAIRRTSALLGGVVLIGGTSLWTACGTADERARDEVMLRGIGTFTPEDVAFLDEIAETILPETRTPGAKAARVGAFMALMVTDTYEPKDQTIFREGMVNLDAASQQATQQTFMRATPAQRLALLESLDREAKDYLDRRDAARKVRDAQGADTTKAAETSAQTGIAAITADAPNHFFRMMKELTLLGYFTSEIGYTRAMRYTETPGRFDPCVPLAPGEVSWAPHA
jgi:hypothetical protein